MFPLQRNVPVEMILLKSKKKTWHQWNKNLMMYIGFAIVHIHSICHNKNSFCTSSLTYVFFINYQFSIAALISSSSPSSSWSRSRRGPSRRSTSMSTVDSTPPDLQSDGWNRFVAGRASCSVDDQVVDATCGQEVGWVMRWCGAEEPCLPVWRRQVEPHAQIPRCIDGIGDGTVSIFTLLSVAVHLT